MKTSAEKEKLYPLFVGMKFWWVVPTTYPTINEITITNELINNCFLLSGKLSICKNWHRNVFYNDFRVFFDHEEAKAEIRRLVDIEIISSTNKHNKKIHKLNLIRSKTY